jgi:hypothetical protein
MGKVTKDMSRNLIKFVKKLSVRADLRDPNSGTTCEFARQMLSKNLLKYNPDFACDFDTTPGEAPRVYAEYTTGKTWSATVSPGYKLNQLRNDFFQAAIEAEEQFDMENDVDDDGDAGAKTDSKGKPAAPTKK